VPPHWFLPIGSSYCQVRRGEVASELRGTGHLDSFWKGADGNCYAVIMDCDLTDDLKRRIKAREPIVQLEKKIT
jgi:hypothetical protein